MPASPGYELGISYEATAWVRGNSEIRAAEPPSSDDNVPRSEVMKSLLLRKKATPKMGVAFFYVVPNVVQKLNRLLSR